MKPDVVKTEENNRFRLINEFLQPGGESVERLRNGARKRWRVIPGGAVCYDYLRMDALCEQTGIIIAFLGGRPCHIGPALTSIGHELGPRDTLSIDRRTAQEGAAYSFLRHEQT